MTMNSKNALEHITKGRYAPIALFGYKRPGHLARALEALKACPEFAESKVFVFIDGPRDDDERAKVAQTVKIAQAQKTPNMVICARQENRGLAASVITEVTSISDAYGRVIVMEDDLIVHPATLSWLNQGLDAFEFNTNVMQVCAHQYRIPEFGDRVTGNFQKFTTTWGWATWKRAWDLFDHQAEGWQDIVAPGPERTAFDAGGTYPFSDMLVKQMCGELDSWGIRWSWAMHKAGGLALMPPRSLVRNDGLNETATHNSIGWLKQFVSGPRSLTWQSTAPPLAPSEVTVNSEDERAFRKGLKRTGAVRNAHIKSALSLVGFQVSSARMVRRLRRVIAVAQLPPPLTGLSKVSEKVALRLEREGVLFAAINVAPTENRRGIAKIYDRLGKSSQVALNLTRAEFRRSSTLYLPCDGGWGQLYSILILLFALSGRFELWLHHHSFAYIDRQSMMMTLFLKLCPPGTNHIFLCDTMADQFRSSYRSHLDAGEHRSYVVSNAFTVDQCEPSRRSAGPLVIGHLSNLTAEKGAVRFVNLFRRLVDAGVSVHAEVAGPIQDEATAQAIRSAMLDFPSSFRWHGPIYGSAKHAFFSGIDVFVFPTRYVNEAQPIVLLEAQAHGCAVLATSRGCIACDHSSAPGLVTGDQDFEERAFEWLSALSIDDRRTMSQAALESFETALEVSERQLATVLKAMVSGSSPTVSR